MRGQLDRDEEGPGCLKGENYFRTFCRSRDSSRATQSGEARTEREKTWKTRGDAKENNSVNMKDRVKRWEKIKIIIRMICVDHPNDGKGE